jgi:hypothetical protein
MEATVAVLGKTLPWQYAINTDVDILFSFSGYLTTSYQVAQMDMTRKTVP